MDYFVKMIKQIFYLEEEKPQESIPVLPNKESIYLARPYVASWALLYVDHFEIGTRLPAHAVRTS